MKLKRDGTNPGESLRPLSGSGWPELESWYTRHVPQGPVTLDGSCPALGL